MNGDKILCPYCGPWNRNPHGNEMVLTHSWRGIPGMMFEDAEEDFFFVCMSCGSRSPIALSVAKARETAALRFDPYDPGAEQIKRERDMAIAQLRDDYGVGLGQKKSSNTPMTPDELISVLRNDVVWIEEAQKSELFPAIVRWRQVWPRSRVWVTNFMIESGCTATYGDDDYGKRWRCWKLPPTNNERAAAEWEEQGGRIDGSES